MSIAVLFAFGSMIAWGVGDFLIQRTVKKIGQLDTLFWIYVASFIFLLPFVFSYLSTVTWTNLLPLVLLGIVGFFGAVLHFKALDIGKLSVIEIILSFELPLTILLGVVFLGNHLFPYQIILMLILFIGIILLSVDFMKFRPHPLWWLGFKHHFVLEKGALLAIAVAVLLSLTNFLTAVGAIQLNPLLVIWLSWTFGGAICFIWLALKKRSWGIIRIGRQNWRLILIMVVFDISAWLFFAYALSLGEELAVVAAVTESYVVIAMLLGLKFNKEKIHGWQYVGAAVTFVSSILIGVLSK